jgi:Xaa-Pro aminopeptidase
MTITRYLLSFPERFVRSALGLGAGVAREVGEVTLPDGVRRSQLYRNLVDTTLRFLIEDVAGAEGVYRAEGELPDNFLARRTAGNAIEALGIVAFRASPVWVLAALADLSGIGRQLIPEIADALQAQGLLDRDSQFSSVDQMLDGLERTSSRLASTINTPPLDIAGLRSEWSALRDEARRLQPSSLPTWESISSVWTQLKTEAARQERSIFETSSMMAVSAARVSAVRTSQFFTSALLDHYRQTLGELREVGYWTYASRQLKPYVRAAVDQFSPQRRTITERVVDTLQSFRSTKRIGAVVVLALMLASTVYAQDARRRWEMQRQIRLDKFEQVLPVAMRAQNIDMWIVAVKENHRDPLWEDLGRGYVSGVGYYIFTDRGGDRIERAALGPSGYLIEQSGAYDIFASASTLPAFVKTRNPRRIGVNMSDEIGPADGLSYSMYQQLKKTLGEPYASRLVSAERLVSEFRSRRVASEIVAFGEAAGIAIQLTERALSNEVITVGRTTLEDVAWWMQDRLLERGLGSEFDMPSVYVTGPEGIVATSSSRIIQPGDVMMIDWGVQLMNFGTDVKRVAYVLKPGELAPPNSIQNAFDKALAVRDVLKKAIKPGVRADATMKAMDAALRAAGYGVIEFNKPNSDDKTDVVYGFHPVGNTGHDIGPSLTTWQPLQATFELHRQHMFSFEYFAYTPVPEWGGKKLRIPIEDDAILMEHGIQFLHPANYRLLVVK